MKSIFLILITVFCATTSAGRPGVRNNLKFECKGTSSYQKTGDTIYGVITGCGDGLQKEIELMTKKVERLFKQDKVRITFDVDYSQNLLLPEEEKQFLWNNVVDNWETANCKTNLYIAQGHRALIEGCGENFQKAIGKLRYYVSLFNNDLVNMILVIERM